MKFNKEKIGVAGVGMVGGQIERWFKTKDHQVFSYDKFKNIGSLEDLDNADIIFLCLPTPHDEKEKTGVSLKEFENFVSFFESPKIFVIKSTIPPGSTEKLQQKFSRHYFLHSPEFLTESRAWEEFCSPNLQIIGQTEQSKEFANDILKILPKAKYECAVSSVASEIFKLARNAFFSTKVIFANHLYDLCGVFGADYKEIESMMPADPWIGSQHWDVHHGGYRGFGGKCLPKDLKTLIKIFESAGLSSGILKNVDETNEQFIKDQGLVEKLKNDWLNNKS